MTQKLPKATHQGKLPIGDTEIPCFVLKDGRRVISGRGMTKAIGMKGRGQGVRRISTHKTLKSFINKDLDVAINNPIEFLGVGSRKANPTAGYEATILHDLCQAVLEARDAGALKTEQEKRYAEYCDILIRSFAKVGIIALVDEATGYQDTRVKDALAKILEDFIAKDMRPYIGTFPADFYRQIFRLQNWPWHPNSTKRPGVIAKWTNDMVYERIAPGVLDELKKRNPTYKTGQRRHKHFQFLSEKVGEPKLRSHFDGLIALAKAAPNWRKFKEMVNKVYPKKWDQLLLDLNDPNDD